MGQKANSNSLRLPSIFQPVVSSVQHATESSVILKENLSISASLTTFFEKKRYLIKENIFRINKEKSLVTVFISFFSIKTKKIKSRKSVKTTKTKSLSFFGARKILSSLTLFGYFSSKRLVLRNLNKISLNYQKTVFSVENKALRQNLRSFKKEIFFESAISLFCLLNIMKGNSLLFSKFVGRFLKMFHRSKKKSNKFKFFLSKLIQTIDSRRKGQKILKGLKIMIKGRFNRSDRAKTFLFEKGRLPVQSLECNIDYSLTHLSTSFGVFGIHVWIYD
jgi:hypothetical protein